MPESSAPQGEILDLVLQEIETVARDLPPALRVAATPDLIVLGFAGPFDSLNLIKLIVGIEDRLEDAHGVRLDLLENEDFLAFTESELSAAGLAGFIAERLT